MISKGAARFMKLIETSGGTLSISEVAVFLGVSEKTVLERLGNVQMLGFRTSSNVLQFPRFQFDDKKRCVIPGLLDFLGETPGWSAMERIRFLLVRYEPEFTNDTPMDLVRSGEVGRVAELARVYLQQRP
ncbi:hypothetical protein [Marinobacter sp. KMM 10035]|uniref:hypothetical protein n=1 Tax=Marinobacter sp. KMM 10035 TaxID=3134034 RepID=UPI00397B951C